VRPDLEAGKQGQRPEHAGRVAHDPENPDGTDKGAVRPGLARALDYAELQFPMDAESDAIDSEIGALVMAALSPHQKEIGHVDLSVAALDVIAAVKGLVDAAGRRCETDRARLERRAVRAALGYLCG
jgi:hypothetical protein